ncbi:hypothetical protein BGZ60DRAFT_396549 [Tricladium varicosporioides]|nr:hypothetical protein BGZ60DRAFT_396549 [Hymenoscyphus varicosporioides]
MPSNTFDEILGLEEKFYDEGYQQGLADGTKAGRIEGRTFGLEKGFEKYVGSGKLYGKSLIWINRTPQFQVRSGEGNSSIKSNSQPLSNDMQATSEILPIFPENHHNQRLAKHLTVLYALVESESLSTENTEEAVSDFDDRFKRAQAKTKIIERMVGEIKEPNVASNVLGNQDGNIEDASLRNIQS